jgi:flagellin-specific chaperone FliS
MSNKEITDVLMSAKNIVGGINGTLNSQSGSNPTADLTTVITSAKQIVGGINGALNPNSTYKELTEVIKKANAIVSGLTLNLNPSNELLKMEIDKTGNYKITVNNQTGTKNITGNLDAANLTSIQTSVAVIKGGKKQKK